MARFIIFLLFLTMTILSAQDKSIHQLEWEQHQHLRKEGPMQKNVDTEIIPLQAAPNKLSKKVFGYLPDWEYPKAMDNLRFDLLTHIATFDFKVQPDGNVGLPSRWPWTDLINKAHEQGVKVILTAVNFDGDEVHKIITDQTIKNRFFNSLKDKISTYKLDGVNIDFESLNNEDKGSNINTFMAELTAFIRSHFPAAEVSFAGPAVNWGGHWDFAGLANACDYIFIMGYSFSGSWSSSSGSTAPLKGGSINITNTVTTQYASVINSQPEKLILGVPYYGSKFQTETNEAHSKVQSYSGNILFRSAKSGYSSYGTQWDAPTASPWYRYQSGAKWYQVWCDNSTSIDQKFDLADSKSMAGVGMWALNYDGTYNDFWNVITEHYSDGQPIPGEPLAFSVKPAGAGNIEVGFSPVSYANGYWVYYSKDGVTFSDSGYVFASGDTLKGLEADSLYYLKIRAQGASGRGSSTGLLAATAGQNAADVLIVDGFDRQSGTSNNRDYIRRHAPSFHKHGLSIASSTNEAVANNAVGLNGIRIVDWILGDESTNDDTFSSSEQTHVKSYLESGGYFFVSGSEIGWDLARGSAEDKAFYEKYLKARYVDDAPDGSAGKHYSATGIAGTYFSDIPTFQFDDGSHGSFDVDWPDAIRGGNGGILGFKFEKVDASLGGAGVYYEGTFGSSTTEGRLVHMSIPFETIYPKESRDALLSQIITFFDSGTSVLPKEEKVPTALYLLPNYPNPFNPSTKIRFYTARNAQAEILIFNSAGSLVKSSGQLNISSGLQNWTWDGHNNAGQMASSGIYLYKILVKRSALPTTTLTGKMTLIR